MMTTPRLRTTAAFTTLGLFLALGPLAPVAGDAARAKDPPVLVSASVKGARKGKTPQFHLGETIPIEVKLRSRQRKAIKITKIRIAAPSAVTLEVKPGGRPAQVARLFGSWSGASFKEATHDLEVLKGGKSHTGTVELMAIKTGTWTITAVYGGVDPKVWPDPLRAESFEVEVLPAKDGETRVGARITTSLGTMETELYPEKAFNTVHNFLTLAGQGFYEGKVFHRIMKDFMVQTGCPNGDGSGNPGYYIPAEFNDLKHEKGVLSMARQGNHVNTAGCQFFIVHGPSPSLDGQYTGFGRVIKGLDVLEKLAQVEVKNNSQGEASDPVVKPRLEKVELMLLP